MMAPTEAPKAVEEASLRAETTAHGRRTAKAAAAIVAALLLTTMAGLAAYFWPGVKHPSPVSANAPPPVQQAVKANPAQPSRAVITEIRYAREVAPAAPDAALPDGTIRIATARPAIDPVLLRGYDAYMASDFTAAREAYEALLAQDARNMAALHGMAAISLRQAQPAAAEDYYRRALEVDPKDALAQSGLITLKGHGDPLQSESRLKSLLAAQPGIFSLHFALGNLYAGQGRWSEAQQAYFKAVSSEPDNPDGLFNLAVGLDQLHQPKLAASYYQRALAAAAARPVGFDKAQVAARLVELQ